MIIDIIVILKFNFIFYSIYNGNIRIRYPYPNTDTLCYNTNTLYKKITLFIINFINNLI